MHLAPFQVEHWLNTHELTARYNLAETDAKPFTVRELLAVTGASPDFLLDTRLSYNPTLGSDALREVIAGFYPGATAANVLVTTGAMEADFLLANILVEPGDTVVVEYPAYQVLYSVAEARGAQVKRWELKAEESYRPNLERLQGLIDEKTKLVVLNTPHNPTGAVLDEPDLRTILRWAEEQGFWVLCDEVYHDLAAGPGAAAPYARTLSSRAVSVGSMSKAFGLSGLRLGWFVGPEEFVEKAWSWKDYTTISNSPVSDLLARLALTHKEAVIARNTAIARANWERLSAWFERWQDLIGYVAPAAGVLAFPWLKKPGLSGTAFCQGAFDREGVLLVPGEAFGCPGHFRIGFGGDPDAFAAGLEHLSAYCATLR
ncbi:aminotransferase class I/II-fold pyridoxal phosphate-dependent enzyme [Gelria sp. Kuro-4]|uniref:aminotransferase class I/II-fold pyridoxal phosphate-dependent enzyme n=1 Tax=Gelria sp. Kuro-4 TaxID=2796927 RepID=UPI001BF0E4AD|nr:aminotransferase class I/II-fold pyridoxal phosphate-dependent enzyme [Gelria sp. Kuro-4]BCV25678.1 aminotransferase [Gelria sp. Kuro-4]